MNTKSSLCSNYKFTSLKTRFNSHDRTRFYLKKKKKEKKKKKRWINNYIQMVSHKLDGSTITSCPRSFTQHIWQLKLWEVFMLGALWPESETIKSNHHHHHHHVVPLARYPWPSLATPPHRSSLLVGPQGYIPYLHRAAVNRFELLVLLLLGHMRGSTGEHHLWARPCFSSYVLHVW